jgi:DnaK suppressor protein
MLQQQVSRRIFSQEQTMYDMDADRDIERMDRVQEEVAEVTLTALDEQERREMAEIQAALARLEAGTYGVCEACGEALSAARLEVLPTARRCVRCQERMEKRTKE